MAIRIQASRGHPRASSLRSRPRRISASRFGRGAPRRTCSTASRRTLGDASTRISSSSAPTAFPSVSDNTSQRARRRSATTGDATKARARTSACGSFNKDSTCSAATCRRASRADELRISFARSATSSLPATNAPTASERTAELRSKHIVRMKSCASPSAATSSSRMAAVFTRGKRECNAASSTSRRSAGSRNCSAACKQSCDVGSSLERRPWRRICTSAASACGCLSRRVNIQRRIALSGERACCSSASTFRTRNSSMAAISSRKSDRRMR
jgi:hypothetical protein